MTTGSAANDTIDNAPKMRGPLRWDIRGWRTNWNWKLSEDAEVIDYQTRFPAEHIAMMYRGADASAPLLATIKTEEYGWDAEITFSEATNGRATVASDSIMMENISEGSFKNIWPLKFRALGDRELHWKYEHHAIYNTCLFLIDPATQEELCESNDNYLILKQELPEAAVEEIAITGTAAMFLLAGLMHNDMTIASEGPDGCIRWKYQEPNWWENEEADDENEEEGGKRKEVVDDKEEK
jgi:hypothetical protein